MGTSPSSEERPSSAGSEPPSFRLVGVATSHPDRDGAADTRTVVLAALRTSWEAVDATLLPYP